MQRIPTLPEPSELHRARPDLREPALECCACGVTIRCGQEVSQEAPRRVAVVAGSADHPLGGVLPHAVCVGKHRIEVTRALGLGCGERGVSSVGGLGEHPVVRSGEQALVGLGLRVPPAEIPQRAREDLTDPADRHLRSLTQLRERVRALSEQAEIADHHHSPVALEAR